MAKCPLAPPRRSKRTVGGNHPTHLRKKSDTACSCAEALGAELPCVARAGSKLVQASFLKLDLLWGALRSPSRAQLERCCDQGAYPGSRAVDNAGGVAEQEALRLAGGQTDLPDVALLRSRRLCGARTPLAGQIPRRRARGGIEGAGSYPVGNPAWPRRGQAAQGGAGVRCLVGGSTDLHTFAFKVRASESAVRFQRVRRGVEKAMFRVIKALCVQAF